MKLIPPLRKFCVRRAGMKDEIVCGHQLDSSVPGVLAIQTIVEFDVAVQMQVQRIIYNPIDVEEIDPAAPAVATFSNPTSVIIN